MKLGVSACALFLTSMALLSVPATASVAIYICTPSAGQKASSPDVTVRNDSFMLRIKFSVLGNFENAVWGKPSAFIENKFTDFEQFRNRTSQFDSFDTKPSVSEVAGFSKITYSQKGTNWHESNTLLIGDSLLSGGSKYGFLKEDSIRFAYSRISHQGGQDHFQTTFECENTSL